MMKIMMAIVLFALSLALGSVALSQTDDTLLEEVWRVDAEVGRQVFPVAFNDFFGLADWNHKYTFRLGVGRLVRPHILAAAFAEYRRYGSNTTYGDLQPWFSPRSYARSELACYGAFTLYGFLEGGVGAIYQSHEELVYYRAVYGVPIDPIREQPAAHRIKLFYIAGLKYEIPLGRRFYIPIALSMDMFLGQDDVQVPTLKVGIVREFN